MRLTQAVWPLQQPSAWGHSACALGGRHSCLPVSWLRPHVQLREAVRRPLRSQTRVRLRGPHALFGIGGRSRAAPQQVCCPWAGTPAMLCPGGHSKPSVSRCSNEELCISVSSLVGWQMPAKRRQLWCAVSETAVAGLYKIYKVCSAGRRAAACIETCCGRRERRQRRRGRPRGLTRGSQRRRAQP